jgi:hypothetical protein
MRLTLSIVLASCALAACGNHTNAPNGVPLPTGPSAIFAPPAPGTAADLTMLPWPSDLFLDGTGHVKLGSVTPLSPTPLAPHMLAAVAQRDGFGVTTGAFFPVSDALDAASLGGHVRLIDLEANADVPIDVLFRADDKLLFARPKNGQVLAQQRHYAYVLLAGITAAGQPLVPSADFFALLQASARPDDARLARAWDATAPLFAAAEANHLDKNAIVCAAVFSTYHVSRQLEALRATEAAAAPVTVTVHYVFAASPTASDAGSLDDLFGIPTSNRPGEDNPGGMVHDHMAFVVQGSFPAPDFLSAATPDPAGLGTVTHVGVVQWNDDGTPKQQGTATVPFSLVVPALPAGTSYANLPLVIVGHGIGGDRTDVFAAANSLAAKGIASIGIDFPFHGLRLANVSDQKHNYTGAAGPDGMGDLNAGNDLSPVLLFDLQGDRAHQIQAFDPAVIAGGFLQSVADLTALAHVVATGSFDPAGAADARLAGLSFRTGGLGYVGQSLGSIFGGAMLAAEPSVGGAVLGVAAGGWITPLLTWSSEYQPLLAPLLELAVGINDSPEPRDSDFGYNLLETLLEPADPLALAPYVIQHPLAGAAPRSVLQFEAFQDETLPNKANEALAAALGLTFAQVTAGGTPQYQFIEPAPSVMKAPLSANAGATVTAAMVQFQTATHPMLMVQEGDKLRDTTPPFKKLDAPFTVDNPIDQLQAMMAAFLGDFFAGKAPTVIDAQ